MTNSSPRKFALKSLGTIAIAALLLAMGTSSAFAHAQLTKSLPENKATLKTAPGKIELFFNELLDDGFNKIEVYPASELNAKKHTLQTDGEPVVDEKSRNHLAIKLKPLPPGEYIVDYRVLSRDGHTAPGRITFKISGAN